MLFPSSAWAGQFWAGLWRSECICLDVAPFVWCRLWSPFRSFQLWRWQSHFVQLYPVSPQVLVFLIKVISYFFFVKQKPNPTTQHVRDLFFKPWLRTWQLARRPPEIFLWRKVTLTSSFANSCLSQFHLQVPVAVLYAWKTSSPLVIFLPHLSVFHVKSISVLPKENNWPWYNKALLPVYDLNADIHCVKSVTAHVNTEIRQSKNNCFVGVRLHSIFTPWKGLGSN